jgi:hypothetical protein
MKHLLTIDSFDSLWRSISQISQVVACSLVLLSLISCGSGGSGSSGTMASSGSNVVMGTMPMTQLLPASLCPTSGPSSPNCGTSSPKSRLPTQ